MKKPNFNLVMKSVLYSWILSYIAIFIIPILFSVVVFLNAQNLVREQIRENNLSLLKLIRKEVDKRISDIYNVQMEIIFSDEFERLALVNNADLSQLDVYRIIQKFNSYMIYNSFIEDIVIYFKKQDSIVTSKLKCNARQYYNLYYEKGKTSYDEWYETIKKEIIRPEFYLFDKGETLTNRTTEIICFKSAPYMGYGLHSVMIGVAIDRGELLSIMEKAVADDGTQVYIVDENNKIICTTREIGLKNRINDEADLDFSRLMSHADFKEDQLYEFATNDGERMIASFVTSEDNSWKYVAVFPKAVYWAKLEFFKRILYVCIVACILTGIPIIYFLTHKNYKPINELVFSINGRQKGSIFNENEIVLIKQGIMRMQNENMAINQKMSRQNDLVKQSLTLGLLLDYFNVHETTDEKSAYDILTLKGRDIAVIGIQFEDAHDIFEENENISDMRDLLQLAKDAFKRWSPEISNNPVIINNAVFSVLGILPGTQQNEKTEKTNKKEKLKAVLKNVKDEISASIGANIAISASNISDNPSLISVLFQQTSEALQYKAVLGCKNVIFYDELKKSLQYSYYFPIEIEQKLINTLYAGDYASSRIIVNEVINSNYEDGKAAPLVLKCLVVNLVCTLLKVFNGFDPSFREELMSCLGITRFLNSSYKLNNMEKAFAILDDDLKKICGMICERRSIDAKNIKEKVLRYIEENYRNPNISIEMISDHFGFSRSHLFVLFKRETGEGLLYYINKTRIEKARMLLLESKLPIKLIAERTGFINTNNFIRVFKKYMGVSPGRYRALNNV